MKKMIKGNKIAGNVDTRWQKNYISGKNCKGVFTFYVDKNSVFFDPSHPPCRQFIY